MFETRCTICGQRATIHETAVEPGGAIARHFCQKHGAALISNLDLGLQSLQSAAEQFRQLTDAEKALYADLARIRRLSKRRR
ncbi:MAG: hypothetical protein ACOY3P_02060 [Planctomycetota bacterium]